MRAPARRAVALAVASLLVASAAGATLLLVRDDDERRDVSPAAAERHARDACTAFDRLVAVVERNGPAPEATQALETMVDESRLAAMADPVWVQLASGMQTLRFAFEKDDPTATRTALTLVRQNCAAT